MVGCSDVIAREVEETMYNDTHWLYLYNQTQQNNPKMDSAQPILFPRPYPLPVWIVGTICLKLCCRRTIQVLNQLCQVICSVLSVILTSNSVAKLLNVENSRRGERLVVRSGQAIGYAWGCWEARRLIENAHLELSESFPNHPGERSMLHFHICLLGI